MLQIVFTYMYIILLSIHNVANCVHIHVHYPTVYTQCCKLCSHTCTLSYCLYTMLQIVFTYIYMCIINIHRNIGDAICAGQRSYYNKPSKGSMLLFITYSNTKCIHDLAALYLLLSELYTTIRGIRSRYHIYIVHKETSSHTVHIHIYSYAYPLVVFIYIVHMLQTALATCKCTCQSGDLHEHVCMYTRIYMYMNINRALLSTRQSGFLLFKYVQASPMLYVSTL